MSHDIKPVTAYKRIEWIDLARAFAILFVITVHGIENAYDFKLQSVASMSAFVRVFCFVMFTIGRLGVPLLFFITGYLLLGRDYAGRNFLGSGKKIF